MKQSGDGDSIYFQINFGRLSKAKISNPDVRHGFQWSDSPVVWRELTERGGRGSLLGGRHNLNTGVGKKQPNRFGLQSICAIFGLVYKG